MFLGQYVFYFLGLRLRTKLYKLCNYTIHTYRLISIQLRFKRPTIFTRGSSRPRPQASVYRLSADSGLAESNTATVSLNNHAQHAPSISLPSAAICLNFSVLEWRASSFLCDCLGTQSKPPRLGPDQSTMAHNDQAKDREVPDVWDEASSG